MFRARAAAAGAWAAQQLDRQLLSEEVRPAVTEQIRLQADAETRVLLANLKARICRDSTLDATFALPLEIRAAACRSAGKGFSWLSCCPGTQEMADAEQRFHPKPAAKDSKQKPDTAVGREKAPAAKEKGKENSAKKAPAKKDLTVR